MRRGYLDGPQGQLHYQAGGAGGLPLLLLHQSPLSSRQFEPAFPALLAAGFHVVAIDMPGFGQSDPVPNSPTLGDFAAAARATLDAFGWTRAHVAGHHTGAVVAAEFAARHPERVDRVVLNGFPLLSAEERAFFRSFSFGPPTLAADGSHLTGAWQRRLRATPGWTDLGAMHRHVVDGFVAAQTNWMAFPLIVEADLDSLLRAIRAPTLLFTNTGEDLYEATRRCRRIRPDFAYAELPGGTHDVVDEQPRAWADVLVGWFGDGPGAGAKA
jgi:pimeloyl-ACP methyl ester carboxylesterase